MADSKRVLGRNLGRLIKEKGALKKDIAAAVGFKSPSELTPYLKGDRAASLDQLDRLAAALETTPAELLADGPRPAREVDHPLIECARRVSAAAHRATPHAEAVEYYKRRLVLAGGEDAEAAAWLLANDPPPKAEPKKSEG